MKRRQIAQASVQLPAGATTRQDKTRQDNECRRAQVYPLCPAETLEGTSHGVDADSLSFPLLSIPRLPLLPTHVSRETYTWSPLSPCPTRLIRRLRLRSYRSCSFMVAVSSMVVGDGSGLGTG